MSILLYHRCEDSVKLVARAHKEDWIDVVVEGRVLCKIRESGSGVDVTIGEDETDTISLREFAGTVVADHHGEPL